MKQGSRSGFGILMFLAVLAIALNSFAAEPASLPGGGNETLDETSGAEQPARAVEPADTSREQVEVQPVKTMATSDDATPALEDPRLGFNQSAGLITDEQQVTLDLDEGGEDPGVLGNQCHLQYSGGHYWCLSQCTLSCVLHTPGGPGGGYWCECPMD